MIVRDFLKAQSGFINPFKFKSEEISRRSRLIELSTHQDIASVHTGGINSLDIEKAENRYLLSGCSDGSIYIHDLNNFSGLPQYTARCVCKSSRYSEAAHRCSVESICWFGQENELFLSSGTDQILKIWDANTMKPVERFRCKGRIFHHEITTVPTLRPIVAVAANIKDIELIDLRSGSAIQELRGHQSSVLTLAWSPAEEHMLASGGIDNKLLFWDIRTNNRFLKSLDQYNKYEKNASAHFGYVNGLKFTSDGLFILSAGTDNKIRLWETLKGRNLMVNYGKVPNDVKRYLDFAICNINNPIAFLPSEGYIYIVDLYYGTTKRIMHGHFNLVNCIYFRELNQELYTGGKDRNILMWTPDNSKIDVFRSEDIKYEEKYTPSTDSDSWSSD